MSGTYTLFSAARHLTKRSAAFLFAVLLAFSFVPLAPSSATAAETSAARVPIEKLLAAGDFVEGEAIAIVRGDVQPAIGAQAEQIAEVSADSVEQAVTTTDEPAESAAEEASLRLQAADASAGSGTFTIKHIVDHSRTTEQILRDLYANPNVIAAEPNYTIEDPVDPVDDTATPASVSNAAATIQAPTAGDADLLRLGDAATDSNPGDLTTMQWSTYGLQSPLGTYTTPAAHSGDYTLNVPQWNTEQVNASGTVCIMDTGIDVTHPDLQSVLYEFSDAQQSAYGCGPNGLNASGGGDPKDVMCYDTNGHGTHVAGIIAASWNGFGVSGIANGVQIFAVRIFDDSGMGSDVASVVEGFQFLVDVAQEVNLKAVNCSWGFGEPQFIFNVMINELGKKGVNTVFASGNFPEDLDEVLDSGGMTNSPYAITVDAATIDGSITDFSRWGQSSTDVFAPGAGIMSTIPQHILQMTDGTEDDPDGVVLVNIINDLFVPEATDESNLMAPNGLERFNSSTNGIRFFRQNPALFEGTQELQNVLVQHTGFYDDNCAELDATGFEKSESWLAGNEYSPASGSVYMAIPIDEPENAKWISITCALNNDLKLYSGIGSVTFLTENGDTVEIDARYANYKMTGCIANAFTNFQSQAWSPVTFNIDAFKEAARQVHEMDAEERESEGLKDPGIIEGVYAWQPDGDGTQKYLIAEIILGDALDGLSDGTKLYVDNVAVGNEGAFTGAYKYMSGTSMAAPAVAGCLAIIAKDEPDESTLNDEQLEQLALERAAKLMASVDYDPELAKYCRTGGRVNLHGATSFTKKAPIIKRAEEMDGTLTLAGYFFGDTAGELQIDGTAVAPSSWSDGAITASTADLANGLHVAMVTNPDGAVSRVVFSQSEAASSGKQLYENTLSLPTAAQAFTDDKTDRMHGAMIACNGLVYAFSSTIGSYEATALWCYDPAGDTWKRCADLPTGQSDGSHLQSRAGTLASLHGNVYLYGYLGGYDADFDLWRYDPDKDSWTELNIANMPQNMSLCALGDQLFLVGSGYVNNADDEDEWSPEYSDFFLVDLDARTTTALEGSVFGGTNSLESKVTATDNAIYYYAPFEGYGEDPDVPKQIFARATYDSATKKMTVEDLSDICNEAIGDVKANNIALAGFPGGVAIIASNKPGEDTHVVSDAGTTATLYDRTFSYHVANGPMACYNPEDGHLYAMAYNNDEPDVLCFRSTQVLTQCDVTFIVNGGTPVESQTVKFGATATKPDPDPERPGFLFGGWYKDKELTKEFDFATPITGNIKLYGAWLTIADTPVATNAKYTGKAIRGVKAGTGFTLSGTVKATDPGTYKATATLAEGYVWEDGSTADKTLTWTISSPPEKPISTIVDPVNTGKKLKIAWTAIPEADGYDVYVQYCKKAFKGKPTKTLKGADNTSLSIKKLNGKKLQKKMIKFKVKAYKLRDGKKTVLFTTPTGYLPILGSKKYTDPKSVKIGEKAIKLAVGETAKVKAKVVKKDVTKKLVNRAAKLRYRSTNPKIASVNAKGVITAKLKGTCHIYAYAVNGIAKSVKVTVK